MSAKAIAAFILSLAVAAATHGAPADDIVTRAKQGGIALAEPVSVVFEWIRPAEGRYAAEAAEALRRANFSVTISMTKELDSRVAQYTLSAKASGVIDEAQLRKLIERVSQLTAGEGSASWNIRQEKR